MTRLKLVAATLSLACAACSSDDKTMTPDATQTPTPTSFKLRLDNIAPWTMLKSGLQAAKTSGLTGAAGSGEAFEITFTAGKGQNVSFASMFGESNDWFFAPAPAGIALYDAQGNPISGDVTSQVSLWNAGTEIDQEPAVGDSTGPKQPSPDYGAPDPNPNVRQLGTSITLSDGTVFTAPTVAQMIKVTLTPGANRQFTLRIDNVSTATTLVTSQGSRSIHVSPPVWSLHIAAAPLFDVGVPDRGQGLERVAESGNGLPLTGAIHELTGWSTPISPGVFALHRDPEPLYSVGIADRGLGLEHLAEDGNNAVLADAMTRIANLSATGTFDIPVGASTKSPATAGAAFELAIQGVPGDRVSFATMFGMSDDWFFASAPEGIALFADDGTPISGDVSDRVAIYDAGTEIDEEPAIGADTGPQQPAPNTGAADPVHQVRIASYGVPASAHLRVTLTPQ